MLREQRAVRCGRLVLLLCALSLVAVAWRLRWPTDFVVVLSYLLGAGTLLALWCSAWAHAQAPGLGVFVATTTGAFLAVPVVVGVDPAQMPLRLGALSVISVGGSLAAAVALARRPQALPPDRFAAGLLALLALGAAIRAASLLGESETAAFAWTFGFVVNPPLIALVPVCLVLSLAGERWRETVRLADTDPLTGLANRRAFERLGAAAMQRARSEGGRLVLVLADVDHLKRINDEEGYAAGDAALHHFAGHLQAGARADDLVARVGGDEFALLWPRMDRAQAERRCRELRVFGEAPTRTATFGVAALEAGDNLATLRARADAELRETKRGRPRATSPGRDRGND